MEGMEGRDLMVGMLDSRMSTLDCGKGHCIVFFGKTIKDDFRNKYNYDKNKVTKKTSWPSTTVIF